MPKVKSHRRRTITRAVPGTALSRAGQLTGTSGRIERLAARGTSEQPVLGRDSITTLSQGRQANPEPRPGEETDSAVDEKTGNKCGLEIARAGAVVTLAGFFWTDAQNVAAAYDADPWTMLCDAVSFLAGREDKPRLGPAEWMRWVAGTPGAHAFCNTRRSKNRSFLRKPGGRVAEREERRRSVRKRWDYNASIDNIIYSMCEEMEEYAAIYEVEAADLVKDVFQLMAMKAPALTRPDQEYTDAIATVRDWFLSDVEALARTFDLRPLDVFEDVLYAFISDEVLPRDQAEEIGFRLGIQMKVGSVPRPA